MRRAALALALVLVLAACGSSGAASSAGPTHADHLACRTVWRLWGIFKSEGSNGLESVSEQTAYQSLMGSITTLKSEQLARNPAVSPRLYRDAHRAAGQFFMAGSAQRDLGILAPAETDCRALGITAANAENMGS